MDLYSSLYCTLYFLNNSKYYKYFIVKPGLHFYALKPVMLPYKIEFNLPIILTLKWSSFFCSIWFSSLKIIAKKMSLSIKSLKMNAFKSKGLNMIYKIG